MTCPISAMLTCKMKYIQIGQIGNAVWLAVQKDTYGRHFSSFPTFKDKFREKLLNNQKFHVQGVYRIDKDQCVLKILVLCTFNVCT